MNACAQSNLWPHKQEQGMIRNRIHHGADGTAPLEMGADGSFPVVPATTERRSAKATSSQHNKSRRTKTMFATTTYLRSTLLRWVVAIFTVFLLVHESLYYLVLNILVRNSVPGTPYLGIAHQPGAVPTIPGPGDKTTNTSTATTTTTPGQLAVVSLHRGYKFAGYLGTWLDGNKAQYAARHGYRYFNQDDFDQTVNSVSAWPWSSSSSSSFQSLRLSKWQSSVYDRRVKFDKLRFLWSIFQRYPETEVQYALWLDGDTVIANPNVTLEDRIAEFEHQLLQRHNNNKNPVLLLAWTSDVQGPNTGVVLLRNCATMRTLLATALQDTPQHTWSDATFADQASVMRAIQANATVYRDGQLLLTEMLGRRLQSRVRGLPSSLLYEPGDWILHLPYHNRLEMLSSLVQWL
jgi:galactosyl transferase GMA12/MNN10 family